MSDRRLYGATPRPPIDKQRTLEHYRAESELAQAIRAGWLELELVTAERDYLAARVLELTGEGHEGHEVTP